MIEEVLTKKGAPAITSDQWHVVRAQFTAGYAAAPFLRGVFSEHADRVNCVEEARRLRVKLAAENATLPAAERDQVFVRRPNYRSLKRAPRWKPKAK